MGFDALAQGPWKRCFYPETVTQHPLDAGLHVTADMVTETSTSLVNPHPRPKDD